VSSRIAAHRRGWFQSGESVNVTEVSRNIHRLICPLPQGTRVKNIYVEKGRKLTIRDIAGKMVEKYAPRECKI